MTDDVKNNEVSETDKFEVVTDDGAMPSTEAASEEGGSSNEGDTAEASAASADIGSADKNDSADDAGAEPARKQSGRLQKRIDRLTKRVAEAERRAAIAEGKNSKGSQVESPSDADDKGNEPNPSDYDNYDDYLSDLSTWQDGEGTKSGEDTGGKSDKKDKSEGDSADDVEFLEALEDLNDSFSEARKAIKDFEETISQKDVSITREMVIAMADTDNAADIAYYLAKNKDEAARIAALPPISQAREIGKLEVVLEQRKSAPVSKKITTAPDPIKPLKGGDGTRKSMNDMDYAEFERARNEQESKGKGFW